MVCDDPRRFNNGKHSNVVQVVAVLVAFIGLFLVLGSTSPPKSTAPLCSAAHHIFSTASVQDVLFTYSHFANAEMISSHLEDGFASN